MSQRPHIPTATYRLQFNAEFGFSDAERLVPYLAQLGISHVYASPMFAARSDSTHGYDVTDPTRLRAELGSSEAFASFVDALHAQGMGLILDIVPNHMAATHGNPWWNDTLANGRAAESAHIFDIDWDSETPGLRGKILLPVLGKPYTDVLAEEEFGLKPSDDGAWIEYYEQRFPLSGDSLHDLVSDRGIAWRDALNVINSERDPGLRARAFHRLLDRQHYRLAYWRTGLDEINYRRFFDISDLVGVRVEDPDVFAKTHRLVIELVADAKVDGVRIDHIDGLADPTEYLRRLHGALEEAGERSPYILVEKIAAEDENLPAWWPVAGTTGYDYANAVNRLFVDAGGFPHLQEIYTQFCGAQTDFHEIVYRSKKAVIGHLFTAELRRLAFQLKRLASRQPGGWDLSFDQCEQVLVEVSTCLRVYRTYLSADPPTERDRRRVDEAVREARERSTVVEPFSFDFFYGVVMGTIARDDDERLAFVRRWQQFTGPVMAKGLEDTALYRCFPLASLNEVGGEADAGPLPLEAFHAWNESRARNRYRGMTTTATHDTKRGEDVRARLNVLSEIPEAWGRAQRRWHRLNAPFRKDVGGLPAPTPVLETLAYQTLLGMWPTEVEGEPQVADRFSDYLLKAARERKRYTSWLDPSTEYETAVESFARSVVEDPKAAEFREDFQRFQSRLAYWGMLNALSQLVLKLCCPGVPDTYQGTELWSLSLVDPDNRQPVDFERRSAYLAACMEKFRKDRAALCRRLFRDWPDGRIKLYTLCRLLQLRRAHSELFIEGSYVPVFATGDKREHVCAFLRRDADREALVVVPRFLATLLGRIRRPLGDAVWGDDTVVVPDIKQIVWQNLFTGETIQSGANAGRVSLADIFRTYPVAVLVSGNVSV